jgi:uncharacterized membrane protein
MAFCSTCGAQIPDGTMTCAACASRAAVAAPTAAPTMAAAPAGAGMADNVAGMLAYFTFIPSIIFLVIEPYNRSRFVRFHSWQNLFFCGALVALWIAYLIMAIVFAFIPILGHVINLLIWLALFFGEITVWIILVIKANGGQMYKLPFIGDLAEKQANAM